MVVEFSRFLIIICSIQGVMAMGEGLTGLIVAGVIAASLMILAIIIISVYCYVKKRNFVEEKESLDIVAANGVVPRYQRFPPTMKFRSYGPTSARSRPPVTFFTVRSPRMTDQLMPLGAPFLYEPQGPVMFVNENGLDDETDRKRKHRPVKSINGHLNGSVKITELYNAEEFIDEDENGNHKKLNQHVSSNSRSKSRERKYARHSGHKGKHRFHNGQVQDEHRSRSRSNSRNRSDSRRNTPDANTIMAQPGDIILNPASFEPPPRPHSLSRSTINQNNFVPIVPAAISPNPDKPTVQSAFSSYSRNKNITRESEEAPLETPREDYQAPSEMPSTIRDETPRDYITPVADYPEKDAFIYPPRPSSTHQKTHSRPTTPEFDAQSIIYADNNFLRTNASIKGEIYESTPRPTDTDVPAAPPPPPPLPVSASTNEYLSAVNRPPTPVPGVIKPVDEDLSKYFDKPAASPAASTSMKSQMEGKSPLHNAVIAEIKTRRQRQPSDDSGSVDSPPSPVSDDFSPERATVPSHVLENRRPSAVQFVEREPEIIPRGESDVDDYSPRSLSEAFDSAMRAGALPDTNSVPNAPPPPPPPPPPPIMS